MFKPAIEIPNGIFSSPRELVPRIIEYYNNFRQIASKSDNSNDNDKIKLTSTNIKHSSNAIEEVESLLTFFEQSILHLVCEKSKWCTNKFNSEMNANVFSSKLESKVHDYSIEKFANLKKMIKVNNNIPFIIQIATDTRTNKNYLLLELTIFNGKQFIDDQDLKLIEKDFNDTNEKMYEIARNLERNIDEKSESSSSISSDDSENEPLFNKSTKKSNINVTDSKSIKNKSDITVRNSKSTNKSNINVTDSKYIKNQSDINVRNSKSIKNKSKCNLKINAIESSDVIYSNTNSFQYLTRSKLANITKYQPNTTKSQPESSDYLSTDSEPKQRKNKKHNSDSDEYDPAQDFCSTKKRTNTKSKVSNNSAKRGPGGTSKGKNTKDKKSKSSNNSGKRGRGRPPGSTSKGKNSKDKKSNGGTRGRPRKASLKCTGLRDLGAIDNVTILEDTDSEEENFVCDQNKPSTNAEFHSKYIKIKFERDQIKDLSGNIYSYCCNILSSKHAKYLYREKYYMHGRYLYNNKLNTKEFQGFEFVNQGLKTDLPNLQFKFTSFLLLILNFVSIIHMKLQFGDNQFYWICNTFLQVHFYNNSKLSAHFDLLNRFWRTGIIRLDRDGLIAFGGRSIGAGAPGNCAVFEIFQYRGFILLFGRGLIDDIKHSIPLQYCKSAIGREWWAYLILRGPIECIVSNCFDIRSNNYWNILSYLCTNYQENNYKKIKENKYSSDYGMMNSENFRKVLYAIITSILEFFDQFNNLFENGNSDNLNKFINICEVKTDSEDNNDNCYLQPDDVERFLCFNWNWERMLNIYRKNTSRRGKFRCTKSTKIAELVDRFKKYV